MAMPICPKCEKSSFAMTKINVINSKHVQYAVHCNSCGAILGVQGYDVAVDQLTKLQEGLKRIGHHLSVSMPW